MVSFAGALRNHLGFVYLGLPFHVLPRLEILNEVQSSLDGHYAKMVIVGFFLAKKMYYSNTIGREKTPRMLVA